MISCVSRLVWGDPARPLLRVLFHRTKEGEHWRRAIAKLFGHNRVVDSTAINPRRCTGFEPADRQIQFAQASRETHRRRIPRSSCLVIIEAHVNQPGEESARGQDHRAGGKANAELGYDADDPFAFHH